MHGGKAKEERQGQRVMPGKPAERRGDQQVDEVGEDRDAPPLEAVGGPACNRGEDGKRNELEQAKQPELERGFLDRHAIIGAGGVIKLVSDHNDHRDRCHHRGEAGEPEIPEVRETERGGRFGRRVRQYRVFAFGGRDRCHRASP